MAHSFFTLPKKTAPANQNNRKASENGVLRLLGHDYMKNAQ
jgi:hypothetical protein